MMYHFISTKEEDSLFKNFKGILIEDFKDHLDYLCSHFEPITHSDLLCASNNLNSLPSNSFYLTFDDGIKQHFNNVYPLLLEYKLTGSFFVPTKHLVESSVSLLEKQRVCQYSLFPTYNNFLWHFYYKAKGIVNNNLLSQIEPNDDNIQSSANYLKKYSFYSTEERFYRKIRNEILNEINFESIIDLLFYDFYSDTKDFIKRYYMSWSDLNDMNSSGMTIGGHTHSHCFLDKLPMSKMCQEIDQGLELLRKNINSQINSFAYPYGSVNNAVKRYLATCDINYAFGVASSNSTNSKTDYYYIERIDASNFDSIKKQ